MITRFSCDSKPREFVTFVVGQPCMVAPHKGGAAADKPCIVSDAFV